MARNEKDLKENLEKRKETPSADPAGAPSPILEEITIEELAVDGICGIY
jgi:mycofactocin precursor